MENWLRRPLKFSAILAAGAAVLLLPGASLALNAVQTVILSFGTIAITSNASTFFIQVDQASAVTSSTEILVIGSGAIPATYSITNGPASQLLTIVGNSSTVVPAFSSPRTFALDFNVALSNPEKTTDSNGDLTLVIGATLTTDGLGGTYKSGPYQGSFLLTISF